MLSFTCWKWAAPGTGRSFLSEHVNVLRASLERFANFPHRLVCVTDDPEGLDPRVVVVPPPREVYADLPAPGPAHPPKPQKAPKVTRRFKALPPTSSFRRLPRGYGRAPATLEELPANPPPAVRGRHKTFPACWRRLWNFSRTWAPRHLGARIFALDIDVVVTGDLSPLANRSGDFVGWHDARFGWSKIAGGCYMLRTGSRPEVFHDFDPATSPALARAAGFSGSDQSWMSLMLYPPSAAWGAHDGVVKINWLPRYQPDVPAGTRLVFTGGNCPPWDVRLQRLYPWITRYWKA